LFGFIKCLGVEAKGSQERVSATVSSLQIRLVQNRTGCELRGIDVQNELSVGVGWYDDRLRGYQSNKLFDGVLTNLIPCEFSAFP